MIVPQIDCMHANIAVLMVALVLVLSPTSVKRHSRTVKHDVALAAIEIMLADFLKLLPMPAPCGATHS